MSAYPRVGLYGGIRCVVTGESHRRYRVQPFKGSFLRVGKNQRYVTTSFLTAKSKISFDGRDEFCACPSVCEHRGGAWCRHTALPEALR